ncbi:MAG: glycerol-3-phosphate 1-O-acyltransferase PlsY [Balneolaceae bacterium]
MLSTVTVLLMSYILGSVPSAIWVGKIFKGVDVREHGSGNAGTTNTFRVLGVPFGITVFVMDFMKGFIPSFWFSLLAFELVTGVFSGPLAPPAWDVESFLKIFCGLMAVVGHMFPIFANFKGGKGAATACGMLFGIEPVSISISFTVFGIVLLVSKYVSLASIISTALYPITLIIMRYVLGIYVDGSIIIFGAIVSFGIIYKHKSNIERLRAGTESKVGKKKKEPEDSVTPTGAEA